MPVTQLAVDSARFREGIKLFNSGEFFEAHEVLEDVWCAAPAAEKRFLQGLIQVAVALHHHSKENRVGARSLLARARCNLSALEKFPRTHPDSLKDCAAPAPAKIAPRPGFLLSDDVTRLQLDSTPVGISFPHPVAP